MHIPDTYIKFEDNFIMIIVLKNPPTHPLSIIFMIMRNIKLAGMILLSGLALISKAQVPGHHSSYRASGENIISMDPVTAVQASDVVKPMPNLAKSPGVVTVLTLGTAVN